MRINQWLARATGLSRREADSAIENGQVQINGQPAQLGQMVQETDKVHFQGQPVELLELQYIVLNKPIGYVCSRQPQGKDKTVYDLLPPSMHDLKSVGRLDKDSSGLLVLTNDGQLAQELTHPSFQKTKHYQIALNLALKPVDQQKIQAGIELDDGLSKFELSGQNRHWTAILSEGRNRQIRRTFAALGYKVIKLNRISFGSLTLEDLGEGLFRTVRREELQ